MVLLNISLLLRGESWSPHLVKAYGSQEIVYGAVSVYMFTQSADSHLSVLCLISYTTPLYHQQPPQKKCRAAPVLIINQCKCIYNSNTERNKNSQQPQSRWSSRHYWKHISEPLQPTCCNVFFQSLFGQVHIYRYITSGLLQPDCPAPPQLLTHTSLLYCFSQPIYGSEMREWVSLLFKDNSLGRGKAMGRRQ